MEYDKMYKIMIVEDDIEIREELSRIKRVNAETYDEAIARVKDMYYLGEIVLTADDFRQVVFLQEGATDDIE